MTCPISRLVSSWVRMWTQVVWLQGQWSLPLYILHLCVPSSHNLIQACVTLPSLIPTDHYNSGCPDQSLWLWWNTFLTMSTAFMDIWKDEEGKQLKYLFICLVMIISSFNRVLIEIEMGYDSSKKHTQDFHWKNMAYY